MLPKKDGEYHVREFGRLPVLLNGRIQPFDSVARNALLQIRSTGDVPLEEVPSWEFWHHPKKLKSTEWLLEVMTRPEIADTRPIFLIHHAELLGELKLQDKGIDKSGLRYYTYNELKPLVPEISDQARKAGDVKTEDQTTFQKQVCKLANALSLYQRLKVTLQPEGADDFAQELADFQKNLGPAQAAAQASDSGKPFDKEALRPDCRAAAGIPVDGPVRLPAHRAAAESGRSARSLANHGRQPARIRPHRRLPSRRDRLRRDGHRLPPAQAGSLQPRRGRLPAMARARPSRTSSGRAGPSSTSTA